MTAKDTLLASGLYLVIVFAAMQSAVWLALPTVLFFTIRYGAASLVPLAILLDGYFGAFYTLPLFSLLAIGWFIVSEVLRSRISIVQS